MLEDYFKAHPARLLMLVAFIMLATIMQALDMTIANVALPHMQGSMNASQDQISWVLTSYMIATAICMSLTGFLTARFGRTRVFIVSIVGFTAASMLCGAAQSLESMVIFRMMQGAFGASLVPLSQAVLMDVFPREKYGPAMAVWGMGVMVGPILGPSLGGFLTETYSWRWVFYINAPIGILCAIGILALLPETSPDRERRFDLSGFAFVAIALASLQLMLDRGETLDWFSSKEIIIEMMIALIALYVFIVHIFTTPKPFMSPQMFGDLNYGTGTFLGFAVGLTLFATMTILPSMLQSLLGYPVIETGLIMMPRGLGSLVAMGLSGRLLNKVDPRLMILIGFLLTAGSLWQMSEFTLNVTVRELVISGVIQGFGMGILFPPLNILTFATLDPRFRTEGAAIFSLVRNMGSSIGISIVVALLAQQMQVNHAELVEHINPFNHALQHLAPAGGSIWNMGVAGGMAALNGEVSRQASMIAYVDVFRVMAYATLATIPLLFILRTPKKMAAPSPEHAIVEA